MQKLRVRWRAWGNVLRLTGMRLFGMIVALVAVACGGASQVATSPHVAAPPVPAKAAPRHGRVAPAPIDACLAPLPPGAGHAVAAPFDGAAGPPGPADSLGDAYAAARASYTAGQWPEAARALRPLALEHAEHEVGPFAVQLYLDSVNNIFVEDTREACLALFERDVPVLLDLYCAHHRVDGELCGILDKLDHQLRRRAAEEDVKQGMASGDRARLHDGAQKFYMLLEACRGTTIDRCDELAYNAGVAFLRSGDRAMAETVRAILADPANGFAQGPLLPALDCLLTPGGPTCRR